jgi:hypothetical protein
MFQPKQKPVTAKSWRQTGETIDRRVRSYMTRHPGISYSEALRQAFRRDAKLFKAWNKPPTKDSLADLRELAEFLNGKGKDATEETERKTLLDILAPLKDHEATDAQVATARALLTDKVSRLSVLCAPIFAGKYATLGMIFPRDHYGVIAAALRSGNFSKLKSCRWCKSFFVHADHRRDFCPGKPCFKEHEAWRVKSWRTRTGSLKHRLTQRGR